MERRDFLILAPAAALAAPSALGSILASGDDARLLQLCDRFDREQAEQAEAHALWMAVRAAAEADPACPKVPDLDAADLEVWRAAENAQRAFVGARERDACDASNAAHERMGATIRSIFETPAHTVAGALAKARVLKMAKDVEEGFEQDGDLTCYEPEPNVWFRSVIADLERLAGAA